MLSYTTLRYATLRHATLRFATPCFAMLHYAMLRYATHSLLVHLRSSLRPQVCIYGDRCKGLILKMIEKRSLGV